MAHLLSPAVGFKASCCAVHPGEELSLVSLAVWKAASCKVAIYLGFISKHILPVMSQPSCDDGHTKHVSSQCFAMSLGGGNSLCSQVALCPPLCPLSLPDCGLALLTRVQWHANSL